jgi:ribonuclease T1
MVLGQLRRLAQFSAGLFLLWFILVCPAKAKTVPEAAFVSIGLSQLPREGQETYKLIHQGGPFPYEKDGVVFGNRERILPSKPRGFYHEYTVKTPGERSRGARRIVCGGLEVREPQNCYYSDDHYTSFREIADKK